MHPFQRAAGTVHLLTPSAHAELVPVTDDAFLRAAIVVTAFDRYAADCLAAGGAKPVQIAIIEAWQSTQRVDLIRMRLPQGLVLDGLYRDVGGTGNLAVGGSDAVTVWDEYRLQADGRVDRR